MAYLFEPEVYDPRRSGIPISLAFDTRSGSRAVAEDVFATNPIASALGSAEINAARGLREAPLSHLFADFEKILEADGSGEFRGKTFLSLDEQQEIFKDSDLTQHLTPQIGETEESLNLIMEAKREEITRKFIAANSGIGIGAQITVGLVASVFDPINLGSAFIPVVGAARYAKLLGNQASKFGRASVRARVGATEGAVGALAVEPAVYLALENVQADYDIYNSFANLAFGAGMGGGFRAGGGFIGDILSNPKAKPLERQMAELTLEAGVDAHANTLSVAAGQLYAGRKITGADLMFRTALENSTTFGRVLENSTAVGRALDLPSPIRMDDSQPLIARGDYILETGADGLTQKLPAIKVKQDDVADVDKIVKELADGGVGTRVMQEEDGTTTVDALLPDNFLTRDADGQHLTFRTKKDAAAKAKRLNEERRTENAQPIKIGELYYVANSNNPFALDILKKSPDKAVVPEFLPPALGRLSIGADGSPHWSPNQDYTASLIKEANSPEGELFYAMEQELRQKIDELDVPDVDVYSEAVEAQVTEVRAEIERTGSAADVAKFDKEQAQAQKEIDDLNEQEAAFKDAVKCAVDGVIQ